MKILVLNCGSSSIKFQLFDMGDHTVMAKGLVEKIGMNGSCLKYTKSGADKIQFDSEIPDHKIGIGKVLGILTDKKYGCLSSLAEISAVGHRVVHGGEMFNKSVKIDDEVVKAITKCCELAPLHNPPIIKGIEAVTELIPQTEQVAVFDTAFHQTMPKYAYMYGIPYDLYEKYSIRRYGFHGTSHRYVSKRVCEILGIDSNNSKIITCHLGNGSSIAAVKDGKSVDTSMGFTPIEGLIMGTRVGNIDTGAITFIMDKENLDTNGVSSLLNKKSGLLGISGKSSDFRDVSQDAAAGNDRSKLAVDMLIYQIKKYIGSYIAAMGGCDVLLFTGGIGENAIIVREGVCRDMNFLGIDLDIDKNKNANGKEAVISSDNSKVKVLVVPTDEELMIALDTESIVRK